MVPVQHFLDICWALIIVGGAGLAAWSAGRRLLERWVSVPPSDPLLAFHVPLCLGLGLLAYAIFLAGCLRLFTGITFTALLGLLLLLGRHHLPLAWQGLRQRPTIHHAWTRIERWLVGLLALTALLHMLGALAPLTYWDAVVYHVGLPQLFLRQSHILDGAGNAMVCQPLLWQMLVSLGPA